LDVDNFRRDSFTTGESFEYEPGHFMENAPLLAAGDTQDAATPPIHVLVIDDDASVCDAIQAILSRRGYQTMIASRAFAGIDALRQSSFDIVMVDIFMPGLNGLDAIEHIRRTSPVPIIAMSGYRLRSPAGSAGYLDVAARRGATSCIRKPFTSDQLIEAVERSRGLTGPNKGRMH
jgi:CheY-like chemotaxis protein